MIAEPGQIVGQRMQDDLGGLGVVPNESEAFILAKGRGVFESVLGSMGQALRPNLSSLYTALVSLVSLAMFARPAPPLHTLSEIWTEIAMGPATYLTRSQSWMHDHSDLVSPLGWALLFLASMAIGIQGHRSARTNAPATALMGSFALVSLGESRLLIVAVLGSAAMLFAGLRWLVQHPELDLTGTLQDAVFGLTMVGFVVLYLPIVLGAWLVCDAGNTARRGGATRPVDLTELTNQVRRIADRLPDRLGHE